MFRRNILEVLYDFRHTTPNIPPDYLFDLIPAIKQRSFSIASSPSHHQAVLELLVAVVNYRTNLKSPRWADMMALKYQVMVYRVQARSVLHLDL